MEHPSIDFYFTLRLTSTEHDIVEFQIRDYCARNKLEVKYYREFKTGHVPGYRECKLIGPSEEINRFKRWCAELPCSIPLGNFWRTPEGEEHQRQIALWDRTIT